MVYLKRLKKDGGYIENMPLGRMHARIIKSIRDYLHIGI